MSQDELGDDEYEDGELYVLSLATPLGRAITSERWLNVDQTVQAFWLNEMASPRVKFIGTVLSRVRQQVELSIIYYDGAGNTGQKRSFCISLADFGRFFE